jgi:hypothetical protein
MDELRRHAEELAGDDEPVTLLEVRRRGGNFADERRRRGLASASLVVVLVAASLGVVGLVLHRQTGHPGHSVVAPTTSGTTTVPTSAACRVPGASTPAVAPKVAGPAIRWMLVHPSCSPSGRELAAVTAVPNGVLVYGGQSADGASGAALGGTWLWTKGKWIAEVTAVHPPPLSGATMAYDPITRSVVLFGGSTNLITGYDATWIWVHGRWTREGGINPPDSGVAVAAYSGVNHGILLFEAMGRTPNQTWLWAAGHWRRLAVTTTPPASSFESMTADAATGEPLLFTGARNPLPPPYQPAQTWIWTGRSWRQVPTPAGLLETFGFDVAYDPLLSAVVLVSGETINIKRVGPTTTSWMWRDGSWRRLADQGEPLANCSGAVGELQRCSCLQQPREGPVVIRRDELLGDAPGSDRNLAGIHVGSPRPAAGHLDLEHLALRVGVHIRLAQHSSMRLDPLR